MKNSIEPETPIKFFIEITRQSNSVQEKGRHMHMIHDMITGTIDKLASEKGCLIRFRVRYYETDAMGIVHHSNYLRWFEMGRTEYLRLAGMPYRKWEEDGITSPVIGIRCSYHHPARYDDEIELHTWVRDYRNTRLIMAYEVRCQNRLLCSGESEHAFVWQGRPAAPRRSLPDLHALLEHCRIKDAD